MPGLKRVTIAGHYVQSKIRLVLNLSEGRFYGKYRDETLGGYMSQAEFANAVRHINDVLLAPVQKYFEKLYSARLARHYDFLGESKFKRAEKNAVEAFEKIAPALTVYLDSLAVQGHVQWVLSACRVKVRDTWQDAPCIEACAFGPDRDQQIAESVDSEGELSGPSTASATVSPSSSVDSLIDLDLSSDPSPKPSSQHGNFSPRSPYIKGPLPSSPIHSVSPSPSRVGDSPPTPVASTTHSSATPRNSVPSSTTVVSTPPAPSATVDHSVASQSSRSCSSTLRPSFSFRALRKLSPLRLAAAVSS